MTDDERLMMEDPEYHAWVDANLEEAQRSMDQTSCLFVYGSLRPGDFNSHLLGCAEHLGVAYTDSSSFEMVSLGPFPAVFEHSDGGVHARVIGDVYRVTAETLQRIDYLESQGLFYHRRKATVRLSEDPSEEVEVWMYVVDSTEIGSVDDGRVISCYKNNQLHQFWTNV